MTLHAVQPTSLPAFASSLSRNRQLNIEIIGRGCTRMGNGIHEFLQDASQFFVSMWQEHCVVWNDTSQSIKWPIDDEFALSSKDARGATFKAAEVFA